MNYELYDGNELVAIMLLKLRKLQTNDYEEIKSINKKISILYKAMNENNYNRTITINCRNMSADELHYIYRFLNELALTDDRISYESH